MRGTVVSGDAGDGGFMFLLVPGGSPGGSLCVCAPGDGILYE